MIRVLVSLGLMALGVGAAEPIVIKDIDGTVRQPLRVEQGKLAALFFVTTDCPVSNYYASEIRRICTLHAGKVQCYLVYTDPGLKLAEIVRHKVEYGHGDYPAIFDSEHELVKALGATVTPEVALLDSKGRAVYQGRIDDSYASLGKRRLVVTEHNLTDAMEATLAGKAVATPRTSATGCSITPVELLSKIRREQ